MIRALALLVLIGSLVAAPSAVAQSYDSMYKTSNANWDCFDGSPHTVFCQTDNSSLTWFAQSGISDNGEANIREVLENSFEATDLSVSRQDPPVFTGGSETDIIYQQGNTNGALGTTWCNDAVSTTRCDQHYVRFIDANPVKKVACHESGHAIGLVHGNQAGPSVDDGADSLHCLQRPYDQITDSVIGPHNHDQVNDTY